MGRKAVVCPKASPQWVSQSPPPTRPRVLQTPWNLARYTWGFSRSIRSLWKKHHSQFWNDLGKEALVERNFALNFFPPKNSFHGELAHHRDNNRKDLLLKTGGHLGVTKHGCQNKIPFQTTKSSRDKPLQEAWRCRKGPSSTWGA